MSKKSQGQGIVKSGKEKSFVHPKTIPMEVGLYRYNEVKAGHPLNTAKEKKVGLSTEVAKTS